MYNRILFTKLFCTDKEYVNRLENYKVYRNVLQELNINISNKYKDKYIIKFIGDIFNITGIKFEKDRAKFLDDITFYNNLVYSEEYGSHFIDMIKELLNDVELNLFRSNRFFYIMIIFKLLDTQFGVQFINLHPAFKNIVDIKIVEFQNLKCNLKFSRYFKLNYVINRKYISIVRNKIYYRSLLKTIIFSLVVFNNLYKKVRNKGVYNCILS